VHSRNPMFISSKKPLVCSLYEQVLLTRFRDSHKTLPMKNLLLLLVPCLLFSCSVETNQDPTEAAKTYVSQYLAGNYKAIYENASMEMKAYVSEEIFMDISRVQDKINGKMEKADLQAQSTGEYRLSQTDMFSYELTNAAGETFYMTIEFLNGHLLKSHITEKEWSPEPAFAKDLVSPIASMLANADHEAIYQRLDERYPLDQVENMTSKIKEEIAETPYKYQTSWIDNDQQGNMIVGFDYAYEGKGVLTYQYYLQAEAYPLAGIFFSPDANTQLP